MSVESSRKPIDMYAFGLGLMLLIPSIAMLLSLAKVLPGTDTHLYNNVQYMIIGGLAITCVLLGFAVILIAIDRAHKGLLLILATLATCSTVTALAGIIKFSQLMT